MNTIKLSDEEFMMLQGFVEGFLDERSPTPTKTMKSLATKIGLSTEIHAWIDRLLEREQRSDD